MFQGGRSGEVRPSDSSRDPQRITGSEARRLLLQDSSKELEKTQARIRAFADTVRLMERIKFTQEGGCDGRSSSPPESDADLFVQPLDLSSAGRGRGRGRDADSPLDLTVKTTRRSADTTGAGELEASLHSRTKTSDGLSSKQNSSSSVACDTTNTPRNPKKEKLLQYERVNQQQQQQVQNLHIQQQQQHLKKQQRQWHLQMLRHQQQLQQQQHSMLRNRQGQTRADTPHKSKETAAVDSTLQILRHQQLLQAYQNVLLKGQLPFSPQTQALSAATQPMTQGLPHPHVNRVQVTPTSNVGVPQRTSDSRIESPVVNAPHKQKGSPRVDSPKAASARAGQAESPRAGNLNMKSIPPSMAAVHAQLSPEHMEQMRLVHALTRRYMMPTPDGKPHPVFQMPIPEFRLPNGSIRFSNGMQSGGLPNPVRKIEQTPGRPRMESASPLRIDIPDSCPSSNEPEKASPSSVLPPPTAKTPTPHNKTRSPFSLGTRLPGSKNTSKQPGETGSPPPLSNMADTNKGQINIPPPPVRGSLPSPQMPVLSPHTVSPPELVNRRRTPTPDTSKAKAAKQVGDIRVDKDMAPDKDFDIDSKEAVDAIMQQILPQFAKRHVKREDNSEAAQVNSEDGNVVHKETTSSRGEDDRLNKEPDSSKQAGTVDTVSCKSVKSESENPSTESNAINSDEKPMNKGDSPAIVVSTPDSKLVSDLPKPDEPLPRPNPGTEAQVGNSLRRNNSDYKARARSDSSDPPSKIKADGEDTSFDCTKIRPPCGRIVQKSSKALQEDVKQEKRDGENCSNSRYAISQTTATGCNVSRAESITSPNVVESEKTNSSGPGSYKVKMPLRNVWSTIRIENGEISPMPLDGAISQTDPNCDDHSSPKRPPKKRGPYKKMSPMMKKVVKMHKQCKLGRPAGKMTSQLPYSEEKRAKVNEKNQTKEVGSYSGRRGDMDRKRRATFDGVTGSDEDVGYTRKRKRTGDGPADDCHTLDHETRAVKAECNEENLPEHEGQGLVKKRGPGRKRKVAVGPKDAKDLKKLCPSRGDEAVPHHRRSATTPAVVESRTRTRTAASNGNTYTKSAAYERESRLKGAKGKLLKPRRTTKVGRPPRKRVPSVCNDRGNDEGRVVSDSEIGGENEDARKIYQSKSRSAALRLLWQRRRIEQAKQWSFNSAAKASDKSVGRRPCYRKRGRRKRASRRQERLRIDYTDINSGEMPEEYANDGFADSDRRSIPPEMKRMVVNKNSGETTLHRAARLGYEDVVLYCLETGTSEVNARDNAGYTSLHECCVRGHLNIAQNLINHGANVNCSATDGTRPLHDAVDNDHLEVVRLLLSHGADPLLATYSGRTPMKLARYPRMRAFLKGFLADLNGPNEEEGESQTAWDFAGASSLTDNSSSCGYDLFMDIPSDPDDADYDIELEFCSDQHLQTYRLELENENGPKNYVLLSDLLDHLQLSRQEFMERYPKICVCSKRIRTSVFRHQVDQSPFHYVAHTTTTNSRRQSQFTELLLLDDGVRELLHIPVVHMDYVSGAMRLGRSASDESNDDDDMDSIMSDETVIYDAEGHGTDTSREADNCNESSEILLAPSSSKRGPGAVKKSDNDPSLKQNKGSETKSAGDLEHVSITNKSQEIQNRQPADIDVKPKLLNNYTEKIITSSTDRHESLRTSSDEFITVDDVDNAYDLKTSSGAKLQQSVADCPGNGQMTNVADKQSSNKLSTSGPSSSVATSLPERADQKEMDSKHLTIDLHSAMHRTITNALHGKSASMMAPGSSEQRLNPSGMVNYHSIPYMYSPPHLRAQTVHPYEPVAHARPLSRPQHHYQVPQHHSLAVATSRAQSEYFLHQQRQQQSQQHPRLPGHIASNCHSMYQPQQAQTGPCRDSLPPRFNNTNITTRDMEAMVEAKRATDAMDSSYLLKVATTPEEYFLTYKQRLSINHAPHYRQRAPAAMMNGSIGETLPHSQMQPHAQNRPERHPPYL